MSLKKLQYLVCFLSDSFNCIGQELMEENESLRSKLEKRDRTIGLDFDVLIRDLEDERDNLILTTESQKKTITDMKRKIEDMVIELQDSNINVSRYRDQLETMKSKVEESKTQTKTIQKLEKEITDLRKLVEVAEKDASEVPNLRKQLDNVRERCREQESKCSEYKNQLMTLTHAKDEIEAALEQQRIENAVTGARQVGGRSGGVSNFSVDSSKEEGNEQSLGAVLSRPANTNGSNGGVGMSSWLRSGLLKSSSSSSDEVDSDESSSLVQHSKWKKKITVLKKNIRALESQLKDVETENKILHVEKKHLAEKIESLQSLNGGKSSVHQQQGQVAYVSNGVDDMVKILLEERSKGEATARAEVVTLKEELIRVQSLHTEEISYRDTEIAHLRSRNEDLKFIQRRDERLLTGAFYDIALRIHSLTAQNRILDADCKDLRIKLDTVRLRQQNARRGISSGIMANGVKSGLMNSSSVTQNNSDVFSTFRPASSPVDYVTQNYNSATTFNLYHHSESSNVSPVNDGNNSHIHFDAPQTARGGFLAASFDGSLTDRPAFRAALLNDERFSLLSVSNAVANASNQQLPQTARSSTSHASSSKPPAAPMGMLSKVNSASAALTEKLRSLRSKSSISKKEKDSVASSTVASTAINKQETSPAVEVVDVNESSVGRESVETAVAKGIAIPKLGLVGLNTESNNSNVNKEKSNNLNCGDGTATEELEENVSSSDTE